jgi:hypothetical protein
MIMFYAHTFETQNYHSISLSSSSGLQNRPVSSEDSQALTVRPSDKSSMKTEKNMKQ